MVSLLKYTSTISTECCVIDLADLEWHTLAVHELCRRLSVDIEQGLSEDQARRRLSEHGQNKMTPPPSGLLWKIIGYFFGGFGSILVVAGILVFIAWRPLGNPPAVANLALAAVLIAVFFWMAPMYPTIFTLGTANLGRHTRRGAGILVMGVSGGAVFPPIQGAIADSYNTRISYLVPTCGFVVVLA